MLTHWRSRNSKVGGLDYIFFYFSTKQSISLRLNGIFVSNEPVFSRVYFDKKIDCSLDCNQFLFKLSSLAVKSICGAQDANACCQFIQYICSVFSNCQEVSEVLTFLRRKWKVINKTIWYHAAFFWSSLCRLTTSCHQSPWNVKAFFKDIPHCFFAWLFTFPLPHFVTLFSLLFPCQTHVYLKCRLKLLLLFFLFFPPLTSSGGHPITPVFEIENNLNLKSTFLLKISMLSILEIPHLKENYPDITSMTNHNCDHKRSSVSMWVVYSVSSPNVLLEFLWARAAQGGGAQKGGCRFIQWM